MGRSKQLLPLGPEPVIRRCLDGIIGAGVADIVVVLGADGEAVSEAIAGMPVRTVYNRDPRSDMAGSVRTGLGRTDRMSTGMLICPSDHPLVSSETITGIIDAHGEDPGSIVIPVFRGRRGHPTLFPRPALEAVLTGKNLREVIAGSAGSVRTLEVDDEGVVIDLDTPEEYERVKGRFC